MRIEKKHSINLIEPARVRRRVVNDEARMVGQTLSWLSSATRLAALRVETVMSSRIQGTPLVSIVMPSIRGGPWLEEAVQSVLAQTYPNWELILVDNGLPDPLPSWVLENDKIKVIHDSRRGISFARNAGISAAQGQYLALLDDDDRWRPKKLEAQVDSLLSDPGASICTCAWNVIDGDGDVIKSGIAAAGSYDAVLRTGRGFMPSTIMCPLDIVRSIGGFDVDRLFCEDLDLCLRLLGVGTASVLKEPLADYRRHDGNISKDYRGMNRAMCELLRRERRRAAKSRRLDRVLYSLRGEMVTRFVWGSVAFRRAGEAVTSHAPYRDVAEHLLLGLRLNPFAAPVFVLQLKQKRAQW